MKRVKYFLIILGMLCVVGCDNRDELEAAQQRVEELELREKKLSRELEEAIQQLNEVQEESRLADEGLRWRKTALMNGIREEKAALMKEVRERLVAIEAKNAEAVTEEMKLEKALVTILEAQKEDEERLEKALDNSEILRRFNIVDKVDPISTVKKWERLVGELDDAALKEKQLEQEISRLKAKLGE